MTFQAIDSDLVLLMGAVAVKTSWNLFVLGMTAITEQLGMPTGCCSHPLSNFAMTRQALLARRLERIAQRYERLMRVYMTMPAVTDLKMQFTLMTVKAPHLGIFILRQMLRMTIEAAECSSMQPSPFGNHLQLSPVTFLAIIRLQYDSISSKYRCTETDKQQGKDRAAFYTVKRYQPALAENKKLHNPP